MWPQSTGVKATTLHGAVSEPTACEMVAERFHSHGHLRYGVRWQALGGTPTNRSAIVCLAWGVRDAILTAVTHHFAGIARGVAASVIEVLGVLRIEGVKGDPPLPSP
jgi:nicotinamide mononucleotide (NMN) deamidase PncC